MKMIPPTRLSLLVLVVADGVDGYVEAYTEDLVPNPEHDCKGDVPRVDKVFSGIEIEKEYVEARSFGSQRKRQVSSVHSHGISDDVGGKHSVTRHAMCRGLDRGGRDAPPDVLPHTVHDNRKCWIVVEVANFHVMHVRNHRSQRVQKDANLSYASRHV